MLRILVATHGDVLLANPDAGTVRPSRGLGDRPTCVAADPQQPGRVWCGTRRSGVFRSEDGGESWAAVGLEGRHLMSVAAGHDTVWAGMEPSAIWRSGDGGDTWEHMRGLESLPSASEWSFPPRPQTHHVRWIAPDPTQPKRLWVAIEAGALVHTPDGGRTWRDRVHGGPSDTHELAIHPASPDTLRVSAGDGYFESHDAGGTWLRPATGLEVGYLRSIAIDPRCPDVVVVSASSGPRSAYVAGRSDGRLYRRTGNGEWQRVLDGWPDPPTTIAPLLTSGTDHPGIWAADDRGVHVSEDAGATWSQVAAWPVTPDHLRGLVVING